MSLSRNQIIILAGVGLLILIVGGLFIFGGRKTEKLPEVDLVVWGVEERNAMNNVLGNYMGVRRNVAVKYQQMDPATYEDSLLNALAAGQGPDVFMFKNTWLPKHFNKLAPVGETQFGLAQLRQLFPTAVEQDLAPDGIIFSLPLYIDTLALYYNQEIFDTNGIAVPPSTWTAFRELVPRLRQADTAGNINRAAAALGGSSRSISRAADILSLLMLQAGAKMTNDDFSQATFAGRVGDFVPGLDALDFYVQFADRQNRFYTWNDNLGEDLDNFSKGKLAMMVNYGEGQKDLKDLNPFLKFKIAPLPQPTLTDSAVNYASYWGLAVSNKAEYPDWAWDLIIYLATDELANEIYIKESGRSPALRNLIQKYISDPEVGVFAKQALSARTWPRIDEKQIANIFSRLIQSVVGGQLDSKTALYQAEQEVTDLISANRN